MLTRRLQVLIDEERYRLLEREANRRQVAVAVVVRDAIDAACPTTEHTREEAGAWILAAEPMDVPDDPDDLIAELNELRGRRG